MRAHGVQAARCSTPARGGAPCHIDWSEDEDLEWLQAAEPPRYEELGGGVVRLADLFSGAGGLTLGALEAGRMLDRRVVPVFAADMEPTAKAAYEANFKPALFLDRPIEEYIDGEWGDPPTRAETHLKGRIGRIDLLVGGPPCQGHSNLNNHTRRDDPKNGLYERMARFAEVFQPPMIIIENVHGAVHDQGRVVQRTEAQLAREYFVNRAVIRGERLGVPQTRHRVFLVASRKEGGVRPDIRAWEEWHSHLIPEPRSFEWACQALPNEAGCAMGRPTVMSPATRDRVQWLFKNDQHDLPDARRPACHRDKPHRYQSVYGRIHRDRPAPTITTGFTVMGQGRYVHPTEQRTLIPREGARLQFFPDWFDFGNVEAMAKRDLVSLIGNAVPPRMAEVLALELMMIWTKGLDE